MKHTALVIIQDAAGAFFLQLRDDKPTIFSPNQWGLFGGGCDVGEQPQAAAGREIEEELTLEIELAQLTYWRSFCYERQQYTRHVFHYQISEAEKLLITVMEGQRGAFVQLRDVMQGEVDGCLLTAHHRRILLEFSEYPFDGVAVAEEASIAIIENSDGRIALQLRDDYDWIHHPNQWGLFGGGCDADESARAAVKRELAEELSIVAEDHNLTYWRMLSYAGVAYVINVFHYRISKQIAATIELQEGQGYAFVEPKQIVGGHVQNRPIASLHHTILLDFLAEN